MSTALAEVRTTRDLVPVLDVREGVWVAKEAWPWGKGFFAGDGAVELGGGFSPVTLPGVGVTPFRPASLVIAQVLACLSPQGLPHTKVGCSQGWLNA